MTVQLFSRCSDVRYLAEQYLEMSAELPRWLVKSRRYLWGFYKESWVPKLRQVGEPSSHLRTELCREGTLWSEVGARLGPTAIR